MKFIGPNLKKLVTTSVTLFVFLFYPIGFVTLSYADQSIDLIKVTCSPAMAYLSIESLFVHTTFNPAPIELEDSGLYYAYDRSSGECRLEDSTVTWEYVPAKSVNYQKRCGASFSGGHLSIKKKGQKLFDSIHIGGDETCYGSSVHKVVINKYREELEGFVYVSTEKVGEQIYFSEAELNGVITNKTLVPLLKTK